MDVIDLEVLKGLAAKKKHDTPQYIQVSIDTNDIATGTADLTWYNVLGDVAVDEPFASATLRYGDASSWLKSWIPATHLIQGRIEALERLAAEGVANRLSHAMAYRLFANNLVDYADKYRGMQSVVMHGLEAFADVTLTLDKGGSWTVPPFFIDSVAHLAGFIMNVSDAIDTVGNFCVTPGWRSLRFAQPLVAGNKYRSYVKMIPTEVDTSVYLGDVYVLQNEVIIGMCEGIKFRRYPRLLLNRFFSPPDEANAAPVPMANSAKPTKSVTNVPDAPKAAPPTQKRSPAVVAPAPTQALVQAPDHVAVSAPAAAAPTEPAVDSDSTAAKAMLLVANEAGLEVADLHYDADFASLGIDSLMSLVIAEKFRDELGITVGGSLFLEYPTVGDLRSWLLEYYS